MHSGIFILAVVVTELKMHFVAFGVLLLSSAIAIDAEKLKVTVYYESLCPYSIEFITKQLYPGYKKIGEALTMDFVPYGNADKIYQDGEWMFKCQHGPDECLGNKFQACALNQNLTQDQDVEYVNCMMGSKNPASEDNAAMCAQKHGFSIGNLRVCSDTFEGNDILAVYGDRTEAVNIRGVPAIFFNDKFTDELQNGAQTDFVKTACGLLKEKPAGCVKA